MLGRKKGITMYKKGMIELCNVRSLDKYYLISLWHVFLYLLKTY